MPCDLLHLDDASTRRCSDGLGASAADATTLEAAAQAMCRYLYDELRDDEGNRACALVRCYKTHAFGALPPDIQRAARLAYGQMAFSPPDPAMRCLTLVSTVGDEPAWNDRRQSRGHRAIPLPSPHIVEGAPMIAQLVRELGLDLAQVVSAPDRVVYESADRSFGIFHVENAAGSPYIPAQAEFVERYGIRSVVGFGGLLPDHEIYAVILFSRTTIPYDVADRFRALAGGATAILARFGERAVFAPGSEGEHAIAGRT